MTHSQWIFATRYVMNQWCTGGLGVQLSETVVRNVWLHIRTNSTYRKRCLWHQSLNGQHSRLQLSHKRPSSLKRKAAAVILTFPTRTLRCNALENAHRRFRVRHRCNVTVCLKVRSGPRAWRGRRTRVIGWRHLYDIRTTSGHAGNGSSVRHSVQ